MEMTMPVFSAPNRGTVASSSTSSSTSTSSSNMQFVLERRFGDGSSLPAPNDARIASRQQEGGYVAGEGCTDHICL